MCFIGTCEIFTTLTQDPYTAGLYPFKRTGEDPTRMFAGEGGPERSSRDARSEEAGRGLGEEPSCRCASRWPLPRPSSAGELPRTGQGRLGIRSKGVL